MNNGSLQNYYKTSFPFEKVISLLTFNGKYPLGRREFAFRWDYFKRNESFTNETEAFLYMKKMEYIETIPILLLPLRLGSERVLRAYLTGHVPKCIDIGPIYPSIYSDKSIFREDFIKFDVDLKDYERTCKCGKFKKRCDECWIKHARPAMIDAFKFLSEFMNFKMVSFWDSGCGGFHIYVMDERVWSMDQIARDNISKRMPPSVILDKAVTLTHLIKMPFSPHKITGMIQLPILNIYTFLPSKDEIHYNKMTPEIMSKIILDHGGI